ncbi:type II secretion system GspH family protein [Bacillus wiedmannii]|uniref:type II secretion system protein n=1 Tax=Bacillus wiedmannii TaxID=1890302 RepID=UPI001E378EE9|nr:type II secretion system protein [Bacillus wiedmannii]MCC2380942.1 type II secretion system GspH family protein [Bacillus wiedmannii]MCC2425356.1 type II secretion system GspH family protein [Bacillus wiedmannii]
MRKGFTLLEVLIVISIISVLVLVFLVSSDGYVTRADLQRQKTNSMVLESSIRQHKLENNALPLGAKITKEISSETKKIIEQQLKSKGVTFDDVKDSFYELDKKKIRSYVKGQMKDFDRYFSSNAKELEGMVFTYDTLKSKKEGVYSGSYVLLEVEEGGNEVKPPEIIDPPTIACKKDFSSDESIRLPQTGVGTKTNPYIIRTIGELQAISLNPTAAYKLGNDIEGCVTKEWNSGEGFELIAGFAGVFLKSNYSINDLYINRPNQDYVGLFGDVNSSEKGMFSVYLKNPRVIGKDFVGAISGALSVREMDSIKVENGEVTGQNNVGMLFGKVTSFASQRLFGSGKVNGKNNVGGISGFGDDIMLKYTGFVGEVTGNDSVGGLMGRLDGISMLGGSYVSATVSGTIRTQSVLGKNVDTMNEVSVVYFNKDVSKISSTYGDPKTEADLKKRSTYFWENFDLYWTIDPNINNGFPYLK